MLRQAPRAEINIELHPKQAVALNTAATEVLYGGSAGGGKSFLMRISAITWCTAIPGLQVYLFRRISPDLIKNHMEGPKGFRNMLIPWTESGLVRIVEDEIRFWNKSKIYLCHCKEEKDMFKYQGAEIHVLMIDELTHFTDTIYRFLRGRLRMVGIKLPENYKGLFPRILCGSNPGNIGHLWVKKAFIDGAVPLAVRQMGDDEGGMKRQFIPARLEDNPSLLVDDPLYRAKLRGLGSEALVKAMEKGDWDVIAGAFFDCWDRNKHVIKPFPIPKHWVRFGSFDWGSAKPFSMGWWAVSDGHRLPDGRYIPTGALVRYREWYGASDANVGLKKTAEEIADGIKERENDEKIDYRIADPACWKVDGGPSIAERMFKQKVLFRQADNGRVNGWDQVRDRLKGNDDIPMLYFFENCMDSIRTLPAMQHDDVRVEDIDTEGEDHCFVAGTMIATSNGPMAIESIPLTGEVWSIDGRLAEYRSPHMTRENVNVIELYFSDGLQVVCTPEHKFLTAEGWILAKDMLDKESYAYMMDECQKSPSSAKQFRIFRASAITCAADISNIKGKGSIYQFGSRIMGPFLRATIFTTSIITALITKLKTFNASKALLTRRFMPLSLRKTASAISSLPGPQQQNGTGAQSVEDGTQNIIEITSRMLSRPESKSAVRNVIRSSPQPFFTQRPPASVQMLANPLRAAYRGLIMSIGNVAFALTILSPIGIAKRRHVPENAGQRLQRKRGVVCLRIRDAGYSDVYCLTVPDTGGFLLANGIAVSNCADEIRYACMSRPFKRVLPSDIEIRGTNEMTMEEAFNLAKPKLHTDKRI